MRSTHLLDDLARIVASPMPRRHALRQIVRSVAGAALASTLVPGAVRASVANCPLGTTACGSFCCTSTQVCSNGTCKSKVSPSAP